MSALSDALGPQRLAELIEVAGGQRLAIPLSLDHPLASLDDLVGLPLAIDLVHHFGGSVIEVPRGGKISPRLNATVIAALSSTGMSQAQIAREIGCSVQALYRRRWRATLPPRR